MNLKTFNLNLLVEKMAHKKYSLQLEYEAMREENDFKAWALHQKAYKAGKKETFEDTYLPRIKASDKVSFVSGGEHFWKIGMKSGDIYDYYPVKNRLHKCRPSTWYYDGLKLILGMI